jgi:hypothetical protein
MKCQDCGASGAEKVNDPYESDINNNPGVKIKVCRKCLSKRSEEI